jgi:hypothetical protein
VISGVGAMSRLVTERNLSPSGVGSVQRARGFLAPRGVRLDLRNGEVIYFWTRQEEPIIRALRSAGTKVFDGVYRRRWLAPAVDDYRSRS